MVLGQLGWLCPEREGVGDCSLEGGKQSLRRRSGPMTWCSSELLVLKDQHVKCPVPCGPTCGPTACDQNTDQATGNSPQKFDNTSTVAYPFEAESLIWGLHITATANCYTRFLTLHVWTDHTVD